jgi:[ribosomal protein S5]-alanine N-acetyltransferase
MTHPVLTTDRLILRPLRAGDADALHPMYSDAAANRYGSRPETRSIEETRALVAVRAIDTDWRTWAITARGDDRAIGTVGAYEKRQGGVSEIGYFIAPAYWRKGYAAEAVSALVTLLFAEGQRRVVADTDPDNAGSIAVLRRLGFTLEATLRAEWETHLGIRDSLIWGLLADEWPPSS